MAYDDANADLEIAAVDELDPADAAVISDGLRAYYVSATGRPATSSAGFTDGPNSGSSMSPGSFCPRIGAAPGSAAGC